MWTIVKGYMEQWHLPHAVNNLKPSALFEGKRVSKHKKSKKLNSTASELLTILPILAHFVRVACLPTGMHTKEIQAFLYLVQVVEMLHVSSHTTVQPAAILAAVENSLKQWVEVGWHMQRKNKMVSRHASIIHNTRSFERSLYEEVITYELEKLQKVDCFATGVYLLEPKALTKKLIPLVSSIWSFSKDTLQSFKAMGQYGYCAKGDVVLLQSVSSKFDAGEVLCFFHRMGKTSVL